MFILGRDLFHGYQHCLYGRSQAYSGRCHLYPRRPESVAIIDCYGEHRLGTYFRELCALSQKSLEIVLRLFPNLMEGHN
jgi:hypothetical protein